jgi:hypothetical protein
MFKALLLSICFAAACLGCAVAHGAEPARVATPTEAASAPQADKRVIEDDGARIEETRVRGQLSRVTVQSKLGSVKRYEIIVGPGGRDPSQKNAQGASGQRAWSVLDF